jgi:hypothetical protein
MINRLANMDDSTGLSSIINNDLKKTKLKKNKSF